MILQHHSPDSQESTWGKKLESANTGPENQAEQHSEEKKPSFWPSVLSLTIFLYQLVLKSISMENCQPSMTFQLYSLMLFLHLCGENR